MFSHKTNLLQHKRAGAAGKKDALSLVVKHGHSTLGQHDFEVISAPVGAPTLQVLALVREFSCQSCTFKSGWAMSRARGKKHGRKGIEPFREEIAEMLNAGHEDQSKQKGPGRALSELARRHLVLRLTL